MSNPTSFSIRTDLSISDTNVNRDLQVQGDSTYFGLVALISNDTNWYISGQESSLGSGDGGTVAFS